ncbi:hypothetical protein K502DRAFT_311889 [Neoconidiobolus thromboides FSU 785]|nr:hypothetical protein K502DRAFT_311889 [Neoconidiobolus thromboides FSU 785]
MSKKLALRIFINQTCSLCHTAKLALDNVGKEVPFDLEEVDINKKGNEVYQKYCFDVPVITLVKERLNDNQIKEELLQMHRVDEAAMIKRLKEVLTKLN